MICQWEVRYRNARGTSSSLFRSFPSLSFARLAILMGRPNFVKIPSSRDEKKHHWNRSLDWSNRHDDREDLRNEGVSVGETGSGRQKENAKTKFQALKSVNDEILLVLVTYSIKMTILLFRSNNLTLDLHIRYDSFSIFRIIAIFLSFII